MAVLSSTVIDTTDTGTSAARGKMPGTRTSCQSEWILQMSTESKYLTGENSESVFVQRFDAFLYSAGHQRAGELGRLYSHRLHKATHKRAERAGGVDVNEHFIFCHLS